MAKREGWTGWDEYAPFYDWENAQTLGRRDVALLEARRGESSRPRARARMRHRTDFGAARAGRRARRRHRSLGADAGASIQASVHVEPPPDDPDRRPPAPGARRHPVAAVSVGVFNMVAAPYGILQSLVRERDLAATLDSVARVTAPGGLFGVDLVPDVPGWREYTDRIQMRGKAAGGAHLTLIESVRQDPRRKLTIFDQRYIVRRGGRRSEHPFTLTFRTLPIKGMTRRLERAGFAIEAVLGDYRGRPWDARADVWLILARRQ